jgi:excisionase family DNA binding protein
MMSLQQVAEYLAVDAKTVRRLIGTGELPAYRVAGWSNKTPRGKGKLIRVKPDDVEALLRRIPTTGQD